MQTLVPSHKPLNQHFGGWCPAAFALISFPGLLTHVPGWDRHCSLAQLQLHYRWTFSSSLPTSSAQHAYCICWTSGPMLDSEGPGKDSTPCSRRLVTLTGPAGGRVGARAVTWSRCGPLERESISYICQSQSLSTSLGSCINHESVAAGVFNLIYHGDCHKPYDIMCVCTCP